MTETIPNIIPAAPTIRQAAETDLPALTALMEQAVRRLNSQDYSQQQLESALEHVFRIDYQLIEGGTYYVAEVEGEIAGCGGWSRTGNLSSGAQVQNKLTDEQLASTTDSAKIRAMFVHPNYARQGIGRRLMQMSELAARRAGFKRLELIATLTGAPLYRRCGFAVVEPVDLVFPDGVSLQVVKMEKQL